jgi:hypothetical protein
MRFYLFIPGFEIECVALVKNFVEISHGNYTPQFVEHILQFFH